MILARADYLSFLGLGDDVTEAQDGLLNMLNSIVDRSIKKVCGCSLEYAQFTHYLPHRSRLPDRDPLIDYFDVSGGRLVAASISGVAEYAMLQLPEFPVRAVNSVYEDIASYGGQAVTDFPANSILREGIDYYVDYDEIDGVDDDNHKTGISRSGILHRIIAYWPARVRSVKVTYWAGFTDAELNTGIASDLKMAALISLQRAYANAGDDVKGRIQSESLGDYSVSFANQAGRLPREAMRMLQPYIAYSRFL